MLMPGNDTELQQAVRHKRYNIPDTNLEGEKTCVGCKKAPPNPFTIRCSGSWGCHPDTVACPLLEAPPPDRRLLCSSATSSAEVAEVLELAYVAGSATEGFCCPVETLRCTGAPALLLVPCIMPCPSCFELVCAAAGTSCMLCTLCPNLEP